MDGLHNLCENQKKDANKQSSNSFELDRDKPMHEPKEEEERRHHQ